MYTIIIPSGLTDNLAPCLARLNDPTVVIIRQTPFCFAKACNAGIAAAGQDDVIFLNDDAIVQTPHGLPALATFAALHPEFALVSPCIQGRTCSVEQKPRPGHDYWEATNRMLPFICIFISRRTLTLLGPLDERFTGYGYEDDDYCRRARNAGLRLAVTSCCLVEHASRPSAFWSHSPNNANALMIKNRQIYQAKWKDSPNTP